MRFAQVVGLAQEPRTRIAHCVHDARHRGQRRQPRCRETTAPGDQKETTVPRAHEQRLQHAEFADRSDQIAERAFIGKRARRMRARGSTRTSGFSALAVSSST
jgi:hypothetical protein